MMGKRKEHGPPKENADCAQLCSNIPNAGTQTVTTGTVMWKKQNKMTTLCFIHLKYLQRYSQSPDYCSLPTKQFSSDEQ